MCQEAPLRYEDFQECRLLRSPWYDHKARCVGWFSSPGFFSLFIEAWMATAQSSEVPPAASISTSWTCTPPSRFHVDTSLAKWPTPFLFPLSAAINVLLPLRLLPRVMVSRTAWWIVNFRNDQSDGNDWAKTSKSSLSKIPVSWRKTTNANGNKHCAATFAKAGKADMAVAQSPCENNESDVHCFCWNLLRMRANTLLSFLQRFKSAVRTTECDLGIPDTAIDCPLLRTVSSQHHTCRFGVSSGVTMGSFVAVVVAVGGASGVVNKIFFGKISGSSKALSQSTLQFSVTQALIACTCAIILTGALPTSRFQPL